MNLFFIVYVCILTDRICLPLIVGKRVDKKNLGVVVIGRNEGERLKKCLNSVVHLINAIVYVDSGSSDGSVDFAKSIGVNVVDLDMSQHFTAARARNAGFNHLLDCYPDIEYVQFVDGDCEFIEGWFEQALDSFLSVNQQDKLAVVFGRRKERFPDASVYNHQADRDWLIPAGYTDTCGGDALMSVQALKEMHGYDASLIAGEEPDLCLRFRRAGWKILSISADMTWHDSDLHRIYQWYKRAVRTGHAFAEVCWKNRKFSEHYWRKHNVRIFGWGILLPTTIILLSFLQTSFLWLFLIYPLQVARIAKKEGWVYGYFCVLVKFPQAVGQMKYFLNYVLGKKSKLIEYK